MLVEKAAEKVETDMARDLRMSVFLRPREESAKKKHSDRVRQAWETQA